MHIHAEDVDNSAAFTAGLLSNDVTNRITNNTTFSPETWNVPDMDYQTRLYSTPDIKDLVQEIVDRTGWCGGNAMTFCWKR